jgi:hypothetical protein
VHVIIEGVGVRKVASKGHALSGDENVKLTFDLPKVGTSKTDSFYLRELNLLSPSHFANENPEVSENDRHISES